MKNIYPVLNFVISGGKGSRLWPLSHQEKPKQFHDFTGEGSLLGQALERLQMRKKGPTITFIIAIEDHEKRIKDELQRISFPKPQVIFEPMPRNTAAAVAVATLYTLSAFGDELILVAPSDHRITTGSQFWETIEKSIPLALEGKVALFGVKATSPKTQYGYILTGATRDEGFTIERFIEKPDRAKAKAYMKNGNCYWNTGIFLFKASTMEKAFREFAPEILYGVQSALESKKSSSLGFYMEDRFYTSVPSISLDFALIERMTGIVMFPAGFDWQDLGSWEELRDIGPSDRNGNVLVGNVLATDCKNTYLRSDKKLLAVVGMKDVAVVSIADMALVAPVNDAGKVKKMVKYLEENEILLSRGKSDSLYTPSNVFWQRRAYRWLLDEALPVWSVQGVDHEYGGFYEALDFCARPVTGPKRLRTLARQIYSFSLGQLLGWKGPGEELVDHGLSFIQKHARSKNGGWVRALHCNGSVADTQEDCYDYACFFLALGYAFLLGNPDALRLAEEVLHSIDKILNNDTQKDSFAASRKLCEQNAYMHLLEAFLVWYDITKNRSYLERASRIVDLFTDHFFDSERWVLYEFFDQPCQKVKGLKEDWIEPGHHYEWVPLLLDFMEKTGNAHLKDQAEKLYSFAFSKGLNHATGLSWGAVSSRGVPLDLVSRSWPQVEAVKAVIALYRSGNSYLEPAIGRRMQKLFQAHLEPAPPGLWIDSIGRNGKILATQAPASILYHLVSLVAFCIHEIPEKSCQSPSLSRLCQKELSMFSVST